MKNILLIGGTMNQTRTALAVGAHLQEHRCVYSPLYADGLLGWASSRGWLDFTSVGIPLRERALQHLRDAGVTIDDGGTANNYDLVVATGDLIVPKNLRGRRMVLIQEGLTEPEGPVYYGVRYAGLPRVLANTAAFGLSDAYDVFCVASEGYRELFRRKGVRDEKMLVTGVPHLDNIDAHRRNDFPHRGYVLVCTSNARETFKRDDRVQFLREALRIADGRRVLVKLHPAERRERAIQEIRALAPQAEVLTDGNTDHMIANADVVIAQYSTVAFTAAALGKELYSYIPPDELRRILPIQTGGRSAALIADICRHLLESPTGGAPAHVTATPHRVPPPDLSRIFACPR
ncbi:MAG: hypothetical protein AMXMBFR57_26560 [Acidimicrobiia bacterium]